MDKLKPCPFCGDTNISVHRTKGGNYIVGCNTYRDGIIDGLKFAVRCNGVSGGEVR